jgi:hypothetical protein
MLEDKERTFTVRYFYISPDGRGVDVARLGISRQVSALPLPEFASELSREGFLDKNAGHVWWVAPGAILSVEETDERGYPRKR